MLQGRWLIPLWWPNVVMGLIVHPATGSLHFYTLTKAKDMIR